MIKKLIIICLIAIAANVFSQDAALKTVYFDCYGNNTSIDLPADFIGPKYFHYEEGVIIDFYTQDTCVVSMLCGGTAELSLDASYQSTDSITLGQGKLRINYYSKSLNRYARKDYLPEYLIMYDRATTSRKEELNKLFDKLDAK